MAIRILHVVDSLGKGGLENGLVNLIERLDPDRFEHTVCAIRRLGPNADRLPADRVRVFCVQREEGALPIQAHTLARAIRDVRPDIVHSRNWSAIEAVLAGRWTGSCALVHGEHGLDADAAQTEPRRRRWLRRLAFELADRVLSVSYQLRKLHAARTGFPEDRISVIHNGVDSDRFCPNPMARARVREELGISADEFCIGCVGNLTAVKDYPTVLKAVRHFARRHRAWKLIVIGQGPELPNLTRLVDEDPELRKRVSFLGMSQRVAELLNAVDVYVLSSVMEGISNSLLEAMATSLPAVVTETGGNPEVVNDQCGYLFPVGDSQKLMEHLLFLQARRDARLQIGQQAMRRVREDFSINSMVQTYTRMYESLVAGA